MLGLFTDRLLTNIDKIDEQHKKLFEIVDQFNKACLNREGHDEVWQLYNFLKNSAEEHFKDEEEFMIKYKYPQYENHKEEHNMFLRKVYALDKTVKSNYIPLTKIMEISEFFTEGFLTHFSETDEELGNFLKDRL